MCRLMHIYMYPVSYLIHLYILTLQEEMYLPCVFVITNSAVFFP